MNRMAVISIKIPQGAISDVNNYIITVRMRFGATELQVAARDMQSGQEHDTDVTFAHERVLEH